MKKLWAEVGFVPTNFELDEDDTSGEPDQQDTNTAAPVKVAASFPPMERPEPTNRDIEHYNGITVKNFPPNLDEKQIRQFLLNYGVPHDHSMESIKVNKSEKKTWVFIDNLSPENVQLIFRSIHFPLSNQKFFDVPIYCKPMRNMTPTKAPNETPKSVEPAATNNKPNENVINVTVDDVLDTSSLPTTSDSNSVPKEQNTSTADGLIPGLSRSEQKKALRKAKDKKIADEKKKEIEKQKVEEKKMDRYKKNLELVKKDFMKTTDLDSSENLEENYTFENENEVMTPIDRLSSTSSPIKSFFTPPPLKSYAAKSIQKEEMWKNAIHNQNHNKRKTTPEDEVRKQRFKQGKGGKQN